MIDINKYVGEKIRKFRKERKMTQKELGEVLGVKQNTIAGYERGDWEISFDNLYKLADLFDVSINDFFPPTKGDENMLNQLSDLLESGDDLNSEDLMIIREISKKYLSLNGEDRKKLMSSIKMAIDLFEKINK